MMRLRDGCELYVERRGAGEPVLLVHAGAEDAGLWQRQAERLASAGRLVVSYDRRGTRRSGRQGWPGDGAAGHAADAADLLRGLGISRAVALGVSSGAVVVMELALRAPQLVRRAFVHEPPLFAHAADGPAWHAELGANVERHLERAPGDFVGAYAAFVEAVNGPGAVAAMAPERWRAESANAETFLRDDLARIAMRRFSAEELRALGPRTSLSCGSESPAFLRRLAATLADAGDIELRTLAGQGHTPHLADPDVFVRLIDAPPGR